jgi:hypothetical protein
MRPVATRVLGVRNGRQVAGEREGVRREPGQQPPSGDEPANLQGGPRGRAEVREHLVPVDAGLGSVRVRGPAGRGVRGSGSGGGNRNGCRCTAGEVAPGRHWAARGQCRAAAARRAAIREPCAGRAAASPGWRPATCTHDRRRSARARVGRGARRGCTACGPAAGCPGLCRSARRPLRLGARHRGPCRPRAGPGRAARDPTTRCPAGGHPRGSEHTFQDPGCSDGGSPGRAASGAQDAFPGPPGSPGRAARAFAGGSPGWRSECDTCLPGQRFRGGGRRCCACDGLLVSLGAGPEGQGRSRQDGATQRLDHRPVAGEALHRHEAGRTDPARKRSCAGSHGTESCPLRGEHLGRRPDLRGRPARAARLRQAPQLLLVVERCELDPLRHRRTRRSPCAHVDAGARTARATGGSGPTIGHPSLPDRATRASRGEWPPGEPARISSAASRRHPEARSPHVRRPVRVRPRRTFRKNSARPAERALRGAYVGRAGASCGAVDSRP